MPKPTINQYCIPIYNGLCADNFLRYTRVEHFADGNIKVHNTQEPVEGWPKYMERAYAGLQLSRT